KAGELGFTKALAQESAKSGITVNAVCPGYIATEMVKAVPQDVLEKNILPHIPLGRLGEPEESARCVVFLASDDSGFITRATLTVNGGQYLVWGHARLGRHDAADGAQSFGASSKPLKSNPGATVQLTTIRPEGIRSRGRQFPDRRRYDLSHPRGWRHRHAP